MENTTFVTVAGRSLVAGGLLGAVGGLVTGFVPPAVPESLYSYPYAPPGFVATQLLYALNHVLLLVGVLGLARSGALGTGRSGRVGTPVAVCGLALLTLCELWGITLRDATYPSPQADLLGSGYGVASILIGLGLVLVGASVLRANCWTGSRRFVPLLCGVAVFVIVLPGVFGPFLVGRLALTVWMVMFTVLGVALLSSQTLSSQPAAGTVHRAANLERSS